LKLENDNGDAYTEEINDQINNFREKDITMSKKNVQKKGHQIKLVFGNGCAT